MNHNLALQLIHQHIKDINKLTLNLYGDTSDFTDGLYDLKADLPDKVVEDYDAYAQHNTMDKRTQGFK